MAYGDEVLEVRAQASACRWTSYHASMVHET